MSARNARFHDRVWVGVMLAPIRTVAIAAFAGVLLVMGAWAVHGFAVQQRGAEGIKGLEAVLQQDMAKEVSLALAQGLAPGWGRPLMNAPYALLFEWTGIHAMGQRFASEQPLSIPDTMVRSAYLRHHGEIQVAMLVTQLAGVRLALIMHALPLMLVLYALGAMDGMHGHAVRRVTRSQESASLYHRAKYLQVWLLSITLVALLLWPRPIDIHGIGVGVAVAMGLLSGWQWRLYKKYL